jgi:alanine racemase
MLRRRLHTLIHGPHHAARTYRTLNRIELHRAAALHNLHLGEQQHSGFGVIPVLKANAYGHGLEEMAEILNDADCAFLAVDGYFEAAQIRYITTHRILVLGYILPENVHLLDTKRCSFVVQDIACLEAFGRLRRPVRIHLELNTGMNRLGLQPEETRPYLNTLKKFPKLELEGVMTHLADADNEADDSFTRAQLQRFDRAIEAIRAAGLNPKYIHAAQTAGSAKPGSKYANALRLGIGLYGINPLNQKDPHCKNLADLKPVLELKSTIIKTIDLQSGDKVSYNGLFAAPKKMRIGVLPLGYYEGIPRALSNQGEVTHNESVLPIVGKVCMNHTMIDLKNTPLTVGDEVTVYSADSSKPNSLARLHEKHLLSYELLAGLSSSIRREVV